MIEEAQVVPEVTKDQGVIEVPNDVAFQVKLLEFDKIISEMEAQVADVKRQKMTFVFDKNLEVIKAKYKKEI